MKRAQLGPQPHRGRWKPWTQWRMLNHLFFDHGWLSDENLGRHHRQIHIRDENNATRNEHSTNEERGNQ